VKKSIVALSLLAFSVTAAIAATNPSGLIKKITPAQKKLQAALRNEMREYLRTDGMIEVPAAKAPSTTKAYTDEEVGDANSFGRAVNFIGTVQSGVLTIAADCTPDPAFPPGPNDHCVVPDANGFASINFPDMGKVLIPAKSAKTLFCHWQTPFGTMIYSNPTGVYQGQARAIFTATYKIENEVLNDPTLIDPNTGLPYGGVINTSLGSIRDGRSLQPGETQVYRDNYTRACLGGLVSKRALMESYGLSDAQATKFFKKDTKITIGMIGSTRHVSDGSMIIGTRFVGD
jgi:hypothetical protein